MTIHTVRPATIEQIPELVQLINTAYHPEQKCKAWTNEKRFVAGSRTDTQSLTALLHKEKSVVLVGLQEASIVACVHLEAHAHTVHLGLLAVQPDKQAAGLGSQMLRHAQDYAQSHFQARYIELLAISLREELIAFYQRRGYQLTDKRIAYALLCGETCDAKIDGLTFAVMQKALPCH